MSKNTHMTLLLDRQVREVLIEPVAKKLGMNLSEFIRHCVISEIRRLRAEMPEVFDGKTTHISA